MIKEQRDRDDFASGFSKLREMKTPIDHEDIHSPYVYSDFVYSTNKLVIMIVASLDIHSPYVNSDLIYSTDKLIILAS